MGLARSLRHCSANERGVRRWQIAWASLMMNKKGVALNGVLGGVVSGHADGFI